MEQISIQSKWNNRDYLTHLNDFQVWDYSEANRQFLRQQGITRTVHVPLGYVPEMTRLSEGEVMDIDVLFYGLVNERRHVVIQELQARGLRVFVTQDAFGDARDHLITRAKVVLNIHYYTPALLETARLGYLWANHKAVASELDECTQYPKDFLSACAYFPYVDLAEGVAALVRNEGVRKAQEQAGFDAFTRRSLVNILEGVVGQRLSSRKKDGTLSAPAMWQV